MLHALNLPPEARWLRRIVAMQRVLLRALATPGLEPHEIVEEWVAALWPCVSEAWTQRFCGKAGFLNAAQDYAEHTPDAVRHEIYTAFVRENRIARIFAAGGDFRGLGTWQGGHATGCTAAKDLLLPFYAALYRGKTGTNPWPGYEFQRNGAVIALSRVSYLERFKLANSRVTVCPYCDGEMDSPEIDHFYPKSRWHFFVCSPLNLVPICDTCNGPGFKHSKVPLDGGPPYSAGDWLHPYLRTGAKRFSIRLVGDPPDPTPELQAVNAPEQAQFANLESLLCLRRRWQRRIRAEFAKLKKDYQRDAEYRNASPADMDPILQRLVEDTDAVTGEVPASFLRRAICAAALEGRAEYRSELAA